MTGRFQTEEELSTKKFPDQISWFNSEKPMNKATVDHMLALSEWIRKVVKS